MRAWVVRWWWAVLWVVLMVVVSLGCAQAAPELKKTTVRRDPSEVFSCAQGALIRLGYTPEDGNKDIGFIRASKQISGDGTALLTGKRFSDVITVSVVGSGGSTTFQVTGATKEDTAEGSYNIATGRYQTGGNNQSFTSDTVKADVDEIQRLCGGVSDSSEKAPSRPPRGGSADDAEEDDGEE